MKHSDALVATAVRQSFSAAAAEEGLGRTLKFSTSTPPTGKQVFSVVFLLCVTILLGSVAVSSRDNLGLMLFMAAATAVPLWLLVGVVLALFRGNKGFLGVYENGFIHQLGAGEMMVVAWDQVRAITRAATTVVTNGQERHTYIVTILDSERGQAKLTEEFPDAFELTEILDRKVCEALLPRAVAKLRAGRSVDFGAISVDRAGINHGAGDHLPWDRVGAVSFYGGKMRILHSGTVKSWKRIPTRRVRNASLFAHLVELNRVPPV